MAKKKFSDEELGTLHDKGLSDAEMAERLGVSKSAVRHRRYNIGLESNRDFSEKREWSKEKVVERIQEFAEELGRQPRWNDDYGLRYAALKYLGSWNGALDAAGFSPLRLNSMSKEGVKRRLKDLAEELGRSPTVKDADGRLVHWTRKKFGSWNEAKESAGLQTFEEGGVANMTYLKVLDVVKNHRALTKRELAEKMELSYETVDRYAKKLEREGSLGMFKCIVGRGSHTVAREIFNKEYIRETIVYTDKEKFADFLREDVLKFDVSEDLGPYKKRAITLIMKDRVPKRTYQCLRSKYMEGAEA